MVGGTRGAASTSRCVRGASHLRLSVDIGAVINQLFDDL